MGQSEERLRYTLRNAFRIEGTIQTRFHTISDQIFGGAKGCCFAHDLYLKSAAEELK